MGRNRKHSNKADWRIAALPMAHPYSLDLQERQQISAHIQQLIGGFVMGLLSNYKPLEIAISIQSKPALGSEQHSLLTVYWRETEIDDRVHIFKDVNMRRACLKCGDEEHLDGVCPQTFIRPPSPPSDEKAELSSEANPSLSNADSEMGTASTE